MKNLKKKNLFLLGGLLAAIGIAVLLYPFVFLTYSKAQSSVLRKQADLTYTNTPQKTEKFVQPEQVFKSGLYAEAAPVWSPKPAKGSVIGKLIIPSLNINEAILDGTDQPELAKAPGHLQDSVYPGELGKSILAAHNVTTFHHLDQLTKGMEFTVITNQGTFTFTVTGQKILHLQDELQDTAYPSLALETCYPLDALYLTNERLFVEAALTKSDLHSTLAK